MKPSAKQKIVKTLKILYYIAALFTAGAAWTGFYYAYLRQSPFEPKLTFGNPVLKELKVDGKGPLSITLGIVVSNIGGQAGCIGDMALTVQSKASKTRWTLFPTWFVEMKSFLRGLPTEKDITSSVNSPFSPIVLPPTTMQSYSVFFMPRAVEAPKIEPLCSANLISGDTYVIELSIVVAGGDCIIAKDTKWIPAGKAQFVLEKEHLEGLRNGLAVIPLDTVRDNLRENFIRR